VAATLAPAWRARAADVDAPAAKAPASPAAAQATRDEISL